jgi:hypothetical protein
MCVFLIFYEIILGFIIFGVGSFLGPKKIKLIVKMPRPMSFPHGMEIFIGLTQFYKCFVTKIAFIMAPISKLMKKSTFFH